MLYDEQTGRLVYTNAGQLPPLLIRDGGTVPFATSGMVVGLLPIFSFEQQIVQLQDGDLLAIVSDGVTEAETPPASSSRHPGSPICCCSTLSGRSTS